MGMQCAEYTIIDPIMQKWKWKRQRHGAGGSLCNKTSKKAVGTIALSIVRGIGYGGGHMKSAGGQIPLKSKTYEQIIEILKSRLLKKLGIKNAEEKQI